MSTIIVSVQPGESRMGIAVQNRLRQFVVERNHDQQMVGSIFKGRVVNVVRGIQAAFVDIGKEQNAFLYIGANEKISEGQSVLVQVEKDARGSKGPSVTRNITLPGHYMVLHTTSRIVGLSKRITDKDQRERLRNVVSKNRPQGLGFVVRTAAEDVDEQELIADMEHLAADWKVIQARSKREKAPALLYRELDLPVRIVRDYVDKDVHRIVVDNENVAQSLKELLEQTGISDVKVSLYRGQEDIFSKFKLTRQIEGISSRRVDLECGGYLVFDYTEAMTVVDVNSGNFQSANTLEETTMAVNRQAAVELARQLQLRDIGGIIVVDFIDMYSKEQQEEILQLLREALADDKMKPKVQDITRLNLVEITRRKARQNVSTVLYGECPTCHGSGRVQSPETIGVEIRKRLRNMLGSDNKKLSITVHPEVARWLWGDYIREMEEEFSCKIRLVSDVSCDIEAFSILDDD